jgi:hypothetical protein
VVALLGCVLRYRVLLLSCDFGGLHDVGGLGPCRRPAEHASLRTQKYKGGLSGVGPGVGPGVGWFAENAGAHPIAKPM